MLRNIELKPATEMDEAWAAKLLKMSRKGGVSSVRSDSLEHEEIVYLITDAGDRVGFITYRRVGDQLFNLFVSPHHRQRGVGRLAVGVLIAEMKVRGAQQLTVNSVDEALSFWQKTFQGHQVQMDGDNKFIVSV